MTPHGVAIFRKDFRGSEEPICFVWDTDLASIERAWKEAVEMLSATDAEELRRDGCFARLVSLNPLMERELGQSYLADDCAKLIEIELESGTNVVLKSHEVRVPVDSTKIALPEFPVYVWDFFEDENVEVELNLLFILKERTSSHAVYEVRDFANTGQPQVKGAMTPSSRRFPLNKNENSDSANPRP